MATRSAGKLRELVPLLTEFGFHAISLDDAGIPECDEEHDLEGFDTFEENASAKARYFASRSNGRLVLADDSGLCVDALGGAPGVISKRWSGSTATGPQLDDANNAHLLAALDGVPDSARGAAYVCVAAIAHSERGLRWARGETRGRITAAAQGTNGFGYDPYFVSDELGVTFGLASREQKANVSHRARAVRTACERWRDFVRETTLSGG